MTDIRLVSEKVKQESQFVEEVFAELGRVIVGQRTLLERLLVGLLGHGHLLLEGVPGLAKPPPSGPWRASSRPSFSAFSSRPTCCPPTSSAR